MQITEKTATPPNKKSVLHLLFGLRRGRQGTNSGVPVFGLDALSSAAHGPEAALTILTPLGLAGVAYTTPISLTIIVLLGIVYFSYRFFFQSSQSSRAREFFSY